MIKFYKTNDPYGFLNNFKYSPMFIYNHWWNNVESAYQAQKSTNDVDFEKIWSCRTPREAMELGRTIICRPDWEDIKIKIMEECILAKFTQNIELQKLLLDTGNEVLVEDSPVDSFWGNFPDDQGRNELGKCLMRVRSKLSKPRQPRKENV